MNNRKIKAAPARVVAYKVLNDVLINNAYSNISLAKHLNASLKNEADRRLASNIVYGVIKKKNKLEYIITKVSNTELDKIDPRVKITLLIGIYQGMYLTKVPEYAYVNDSVNLVKMFVSMKPASFVNGILRNFLKRKVEFRDLCFEDYYERMYYEYGFSKDIINMLEKSYTKEKIESFGEYSTLPPNVTIRINNLKSNIENVKDFLSSENISYEENTIKDSLTIKSHVNVASLKGFKDGLFAVQDPSTMLVGFSLDLEENMEVLDMCSAPGGKALHASDLMNNTGKITAFDIYQKKLDLIRFNKKVLGAENIWTEKKDATIFDESLVGKFDRVICDVPCSGLGVIRRKPEIIHKVNRDGINDLIKIQKKILSNGLSYLKKGGVLIYSTCSINYLENEDIVSSVLSDHKDIKYDKIKLPFDFPVEDFKINVDDFSLGYDGFFVCKVVKN